METTQQGFAGELDLAATAMFERQQRELDKYKTRYVYLPFMHGCCSPQVTGGSVPAGVAHAIAAPYGKLDVRLVPEGAQMLMVVSPSTGVSAQKAALAHKDPEMLAMMQRLRQLEEQLAKDRGQEPASVAIYLHEVAPIVHDIISYYGTEGAIEINALAGIPERAFEQHGINDKLFGAEGERPVTARGIRVRMQAVVEQAKKQKGEEGRVMGAIAMDVLRSVDQCEKFCKEHIRSRHLEMEDPKSDAPKRYSARDLRALDFTEQPRLYEYMERQAEEQRAAEKAAADREERLINLMERRDQQFERLLGDMSGALQAIAKNQSKN